MIQLRPREYFTIVRGLPDHTDAGTYYVRAVIRNAKTDAVIDTVNLTNQGNRRFSYAWQVPADVSEQGFYILITTSVYSDSGYTTKDPNYGEEFATYLIQDRVNPNNLGPIGPDVDYKKIQKMIEAAVAGIKMPEMPEPVEQDDTEMMASMEACRMAVEALPAKFAAMLPAAEKMDMEPMRKLMQQTLDAVSAIEIPEQKEPDMSPVVEALQEMKKMLDVSDIVDAKTSLKTIADWVTKFGASDMDGLRKIADALKEQMDSMPYIIKNAPAPKEQKGFVQ